MPKPFAVRKTWTTDLTRLMRLKGAIEANKQRPEAFRNRACELINELILLLTRDETSAKQETK